VLQTIVRVCQIAFLVVATIALGWFLAGKLGGERKRELPAFERVLAERAVDRVVEDLPRRETLRRLLVLPVSGQDLDGRVTDLLLERLEARDEYDAIDAREFEGVLTPKDADEAIKAFRKLSKEARPDGILFASVRRDHGRQGVGARVELEARLIDPKADFTGEVVRKTERIESRASIDWFAPFMEQISAPLRLLGWVLFTIGFPFALFPVVQGVTRRENNRWNAVLLGGLTAADGALALVLLGLRPGAFGWMLIVLACMAGFVYNFVICDRIDEMRK